MNHPNEDQLLLLAYGELPAHEAEGIESHIAACAACAYQLVQFERSRVVVEITRPARLPRARILWTTALAAAAMIAIVLIERGRLGSYGSNEGWKPTTTWSATAGYVAGGKDMIDIDAQLTRLEQERYRGLPN